MMATQLIMSFFLCPLLVWMITSTPIYAAATISRTSTSYNVVMGFGAKPNGLRDSTEAFLRAWGAACASADAALIYVPKGRYLLRPLAFTGPCTHITFRIDGTLLAPLDYRILGGAENWLSFHGVSGVSVIGGALDARGPSLWACKAKAGNSCPTGATVRN